MHRRNTAVAARVHSPEDSPTPKPDFFIELCELVNRKVPPHATFVSDKIGREKMYWRELYRWVELEEMYDHVIGEFSPAEITRLDYRAICKFQTQLRQNFLLTRYACTDYEEFTKLLADDVASFIQKRPFSFTPALAKVLLAPRFHPQVEKRRFSVQFQVGHHNNANRRPINEHIAACCAEDTTSCCIMTGVLPLLPYDILILAQLENKMDPVGVVEVPYPLRLVVLALTPRKSNYLRMLEVAHTFGIFLNDKDFQLTCEAATSSDDLLNAIDVYLSKTVVMPRQRRTVVPFPTVVPHKEIAIILSEANLDTALRQVSEDSTEVPEHEEPVKTEHFTAKRCLHTVWPPMRDVVKGTCAVGRRFASDFADAFTKPNIGLVFGSIFLVYFVIFGPAITFGTLMNTQIHTSFSVSNSILTSGVVTIMNALFAGQPIAIIGPSGPSFIMEALIAQEAGKFGVELYDYRFWVCIYSVVCGIFLIALNLSEVATTTTKSLEELYSACIAGFLIIKALFSVFKPIPHDLPTGPGPINGSDLALLRTAATTGVTAFLALSMAVFCITVAQIKQSRMFRRKIRFWVGSLTVPLGIIFVTVLERIFFSAFKIPTLKVPPFKEINYSTWYRLPDFNDILFKSNSESHFIHLSAAVHGFVLGVLIFVEVSFNSVVVLASKAAKPSPIASDHLLSNIVYPLFSAFLGFPLVSGVPVRTTANLRALVKYEVNPPPGRAPKALYIIEQRVNTLIVGILITLSVFIGDVLHYIPLAALYGLFLYLGLFCLKGMQLIVFLRVVLTRRKYWGEWALLDGLPNRQVVVFTLIWLLELTVLLVLLIFSEFPILLPAAASLPFVLLLAGILRRFAMPRWKWMAPYLERMDPRSITTHVTEPETEITNDSLEDRTQEEEEV